MSAEIMSKQPRESASGTPDRRKAALQEYFALERSTDVPHEYLNGDIVAMAGETPVHNVICGNVYYRLRVAFETRHCQAYMENVRTRVSPTKYRYPDIVADVSLTVEQIYSKTEFVPVGTQSRKHETPPGS
jgi:Uma2 family endonuclease